MGSRERGHREQPRHALTHWTDRKRHDRDSERDTSVNQTVSPVPTRDVDDRPRIAIYKDRIIIPPALLAAHHAAPGGVYDDGKSGNIDIQARYNFGHRQGTQRMPALPSYGPVAASRATHLVRLPVPSDILGLLLVQGRALPSSC